MTDPVPAKKYARFLKWTLLANLSLMLIIVMLVIASDRFSYPTSSTIASTAFRVYMVVALIGIFQIVVGTIGLMKEGCLRYSASNLVCGTLAIAPSALFVLAGGGWGRPLRIKGRQLHPELREGSDWTQGPRPDPTGLDEDTRRALEALWLHDAQKEHASVPAFSRISWLLAAVGAPAELMEWSHRAALEEIEHTRLCFALAAGYAGRSHTVEPMPDLLVGGLDVKGDALALLASESLSDGCQLEDFNADVAAACAMNCEEPATRAVLEQIAREERSHADFSWALVEWLLARSPASVTAALHKASAKLSDYRRPTAASWKTLPLVQKADPDLMLRHGRLPDTRWGELWDARLVETRRRLEHMLTVKAAA